MIINKDCVEDIWEVTCSTKLADADHFYTKPQTDAKIAEMSGATPEQVQEMINDSLGNYYDKSQMDNTVGALEASDGVISGAVDNATSALTQETQRAQDAEGALSNEIATKANAVDVYTKVETDTLLADKSSTATTQDISNTLDAHTADTTIHVTTEEKTSWNNKAETSAVTEAISAAVANKADNSAVTEAITSAVSGKANSDEVYTKLEVDRFVDDLENTDFYISGAVSTLSSNLDNISSAVTAEVIRAQNAENTLANQLANKADSSSVYTKTQTDNAISAATSGKADSTTVTQEISAAVSGKADTTAVTEAISAATSGKANADSVYTKSETDSLLNNKADSSSVYTKSETDSLLNDKANTTAVTEAITSAVSGKADSDSVYTKNETDLLLDNKADSSAVTEAISSAVSGKADTSAVTEAISAAVSGKADSSAVTEEITAAVSGKADTSAVTEAISSAVSGKADTSAVTEAISSAVSGKADTSAVTEAISAATSGKADSNSVYTKSETDDEISAAVSSKQDTLVSGTNIKTINNESILGSGNINIQGGSGISSAECQTMIDNSISGKADSSSVYTKTEVDSALSGKASTATTQTISNTLGTHTADTTIHVTSQDKTNWNGKQDALVAGDNITISGNVISATGGGSGVTSGEVETMIQESISGHTADTTIHVTSQEKTTWDGKQNALSAGSGITITNNTVSAKIWSGTLVQYENLATKDNDTIYLILN